MSRLKGLLQLSGNFEPQIAAPFDARAICDNFSDLLLPDTWEAKDGTVYTYVGMRVTVTSDTTVSKRGVYYLNSSDYTDIASWTKLEGGSSTGGVSKKVFPLTGKTNEIAYASHLFDVIVEHVVVNTSSKSPVFVTNYITGTNSVLVDSLVDLDGYELVITGA